jgi:hypothetical protein
MRPQCHAAVEHPFPLWIRRAASDNKAPRRSFPSEAKVPSADAREFLHGWLAGGAFFPLLSVSSLLRTHDLCVRPCPNCFLTAMFQRGMHDFACHRSLPPVCLPVCPSVFRFSSDSRVRGVNFMLPAMIMTATTMVTEYAELKCGVKARRESRRRKGEKKGGDNHMTKSKEQRRGSLTTIYQPGLTTHPPSHAEDVKTVPVISQMCRRVGPSPPPTFTGHVSTQNALAAIRRPAVSAFSFSPFLLSKRQVGCPMVCACFIPYALCNAHPGRGGGGERSSLRRRNTIVRWPARPAGPDARRNPAMRSVAPGSRASSSPCEGYGWEKVPRMVTEKRWWGGTDVSLIFVPENREKQSRRDPASAGGRGRDLFRYIEDNC